MPYYVKYHVLKTHIKIHCGNVDTEKFQVFAQVHASYSMTKNVGVSFLKLCILGQFLSSLHILSLNYLLHTNGL